MLSVTFTCYGWRTGDDDRNAGPVTSERPGFRCPTLRNQSIIYQRRRRSALGQVLEPGGELRPEQYPTVEGGQRQAEARVFLEGALRGLPPRQRAAVLLRHVEAFSAPQVAPRIGCRPNSVRVLLLRARRKLRAALQGDPPAAALPAGKRREGSGRPRGRLRPRGSGSTLGIRPTGRADRECGGPLPGSRGPREPGSGFRRRIR